MSAERIADVAVVGGGLAGLVAGRELHRRGADVVVLEARDRVGGRTLNYPLGAEKVVEVGGQWVGPSQHRVLALIEELGLETFPTHDQGRHIFEHRGRMHRHRGRIPFVPSPGLGEGYLALLRLERLARSVPAEAPWSAPRALRWDGETVESWARRHIRSHAGRQVIAMVCEAVWAADPADVSLLHLLAYANAAGGINRLIETAGGAQDSRIIGGSQQIALALADELAGHVVLRQPVRQIEHTAQGVTLQCPQLTVRARRAIIATSPALAGRIAYSPSLGSDRDQLTQRTPNGSVIKCLAIYEESFWRHHGLSGQVTSTTGPVKVIFDNSPSDGNPGVLLAFLEGRHARILARQTASERRKTVLGCLAKFFGSRATAPHDYIEKDWSAEEWTRGCYGAFFPPNTWTSYGHALRSAIGRLHWAGAETATVWMGYMDGAVGSGERAAVEVLDHLASEAGQEGLTVLREEPEETRRIGVRRA